MAFVLLVEAFAMPPLGAAVLAFLVAVTVSYKVNRRWTFGMTLMEQGGAYLNKYLLVATGGIFVNAGITYVVVNVLGYWYGFALALTLIVVPPTTFVLAKTWVFVRDV